MGVGTQPNAANRLPLQAMASAPKATHCPTPLTTNLDVNTLRQGLEKIQALRHQLQGGIAPKASQVDIR